MRDAILYLSAFVDAFLAATIFSSVMREKGIKKRKLVSYLAITLSVVTMSYIIAQPTLRLVLCTTAVFFISFLYYDSDLLSRLMACAFFFSAYLIGEYFAHGIVAMVNEYFMPGDNLFLIGVVASYAYWLSFCAFYKILDLRLHDPADNVSRFLVLGTSVTVAGAMIVLVEYIMKAYKIEEFPYPFYLVIAAAFLMINVLTMSLSKRISALNREHNMSMIFQTQVKQQKQYRASLEQAYADMRGIYHDMKHHLTAVFAMAGEKEKPVIGQYIDVVLDRVPIPAKYGGTGNAMLDATLHTYLASAERQGVQIELEAEALPKAVVHEDLCVILGNALDNALEACEKIDKSKSRPAVHIAIYSRGEYLHIHIENPFAGKITFENGRPVTTKADRKRHGYGLKNVEKAVRKLDGALDCTANDGVFTFHSMIHMETCADPFADNDQ